MVGSIFTGCTTIPTNNPRTLHLKKNTSMSTSSHFPSPPPPSPRQPLSHSPVSMNWPILGIVYIWNHTISGFWTPGFGENFRQQIITVPSVPGYFTDLSQGLRGRPCHKKGAARTGWLGVAGQLGLNIEGEAGDFSEILRVIDNWMIVKETARPKIIALSLTHPKFHFYDFSLGTRCQSVHIKKRQHWEVELLEGGCTSGSQKSHLITFELQFFHL